MVHLQIVLVIILVGLQYRLWVAENGYLDQEQLDQRIQKQQNINEEQSKKNERLQANIEDLKTDLDATEELARQNLGLIKPGEIFVIMIEKEK